MATPSVLFLKVQPRPRNIGKNENSSIDNDRSNDSFIALARSGNLGKIFEPDDCSANYSNRCRYPPTWLYSQSVAPGRT